MTISALCFRCWNEIVLLSFCQCIIGLLFLSNVWIKRILNRGVCSTPISWLKLYVIKVINYRVRCLLMRQSSSACVGIFFFNITCKRNNCWSLWTYCFVIFANFRWEVMKYDIIRNIIIIVTRWKRMAEAALTHEFDASVNISIKFITAFQFEQMYWQLKIYLTLVDMERN